MDYYVSRAMQISCLSPEQIIALHNKERGLSRLLANFEVQRVFGLQPVKELLMIPEEGAAQEQHAARVRNDLLSKKVAVDLQLTDGKGNVELTMKPWEYLIDTTLERIHAFDVRVQGAIEDGKISFAYEGPVASGVRLRDRTKASRVLA